MNTAVCIVATFVCMWTASSAQSYPSEKVLSFASLLSTRLGVSAQAPIDLVHDRVVEMFKPVDIPSLRPNVTVFFNETLKGRWTRNLIYVLGEDGDGGIQIKGYFLKGQVSEGDLLSLTEDDLIFSDDCTAHFQQYGKALFNGTWPTCSTADETAHPNYVMSWTCESLTVTADDPYFRKMHTYITNVLYVKERYPLFPYSLKGVPDFKSPCDN